MKLISVVAEDLLSIEIQLRRDRDTEGARRRVQSLLGGLEGQLAELFTVHHQPAAADAAASVVVRALRPWLVRSALAERCLRRPHGRVVTSQVVAHVLFNIESGDGLGRVLDRWLLDRSTMSAMRTLASTLARAATAALPAHSGRRVMVVGAGTGSLAGAVQLAMQAGGGTLTVVDRSPQALTPIAAIRDRAPRVELRTQTVDLAAFATGRHLPEMMSQDLIVVHTLHEYLPDQLVVSFSRTLDTYLAPGGKLVIGALAHSRDDALLRYVLGWATVRRTGEELSTLIVNGGLKVENIERVRGPALVLTAASSR